MTLPPAAGARLSPDEYCQDKAAQSGSSFYYSFLFLPPERRRAITALYAFCREVDDIVDECTDTGVAHTKLAWWRQELARLYAGEPQHPVARALQPAIEPFGIKHEYLAEIIDGMEMDLSQNRYIDFPALEQYCHRVAGVVGLLAASIFGYRDEQTLDYAHTLGLAFQLTNIIRDVGEDSRKGRIYLPLSELRQFEVSAADILHARQSENFARLMAFQIERAERYYTAALEKLPDVDRETQRPGLIMAAIYRTLLREIEADGCMVLTRRTALTPLRKLWIAWKTWMGA
jgi:15-cis-phytoene synthase